MEVHGWVAHFNVDARHVPLAGLRLHRRARLSYVYNFIDHWECELRLEGRLPWDPQHHYLVCLGGKQAAPPDNGGARGPIYVGRPARGPLGRHGHRRGHTT
jgi:hypothetical protein